MRYRKLKHQCNKRQSSLTLNVKHHIASAELSILLACLFQILSFLILQHELATIKSFGVSARGIAFHTAQSHQRLKRFGLKPTLSTLRLESIHDVSNFLLAHIGLKRHEDTRLSHVAVIFGDLVFENQMIPKRIPGQFRQEAMILVGIPAVVSKNEVRRNRLFSSSKTAFTSAPTNGMNPSRKFFSCGPRRVLASETERCRFLRFRRANSSGTKHDPVEHAAWILLCQAKNGSTTSNLDVV